MAAILTLEAIGPKGEQLALQAAVFEALSGLDAEWQDHLRVAE